MPRFLLVHPPLLGPTVWQGCAAALRARGYEAFVPDLRPAVADADQWWSRYADDCADYLGEDTDTVVVGHSGSGPALPLIISRARARSAVFVDARLPSRGPSTAPSERSRSFVRGLVERDGRLPVWTRWWPEEELDSLVPDADLRRRIVAEQTALQVRFYDLAVPVPVGWDDGLDIRYVRLSAAYDQEALDAAARGWAVRRLDGGHLHMVNNPDETTDALLA